MGGEDDELIAENGVGTAEDACDIVERDVVTNGRGRVKGKLRFAA